MISELFLCGLVSHYELKGSIDLMMLNNPLVISIAQDCSKKSHYLPHWQSSEINITSSGIYISKT